MCLLFVPFGTASGGLYFIRTTPLTDVKAYTTLTPRTDIKADVKFFLHVVMVNDHQFVSIDRARDSSIDR